MRERKKLLLRLDPEVYEAIARWAADDLRSVNAQIEYALRFAMHTAGRTPRVPRTAGRAGGDATGAQSDLDAAGTDDGAGQAGGA